MKEKSKWNTISGLDKMTEICENCGHSITFHGSKNRGRCGKRERGIYCKCKKFTTKKVVVYDDVAGDTFEYEYPKNHSPHRQEIVSNVGAPGSEDKEPEENKRGDDWDRDSLSTKGSYNFREEVKKAFDNETTFTTGELATIYMIVGAKFNEFIRRLKTPIEAEIKYIEKNILKPERQAGKTMHLLLSQLSRKIDKLAGKELTK